MPTKRKPKWGAKSTILSKDGKNAYSKKAIQDIAADFGIPPEQIPAVQEGLENAAWVYRTYRKNLDLAPRPGEKLAAISEIKTAASNLLKKLEELDQWTANDLWTGARAESFEEAMASIEMLASNEAVIFRQSAGKEGVIEALTSLYRYCTLAQEVIQKDRGGAKRDEPMRRWALSIARLWIFGLGRPLTVTAYHKGEPRSQAARFAWAVFQRMEHRGSERIATSRILGVMRSARKDRAIVQANDRLRSERVKKPGSKST